MTPQDNAAPPALDQLSAAIGSSLSLKEIEKALHRLPIPAEIKPIAREIARIGVTVGERLLRIGRLIIGFVIDLAKFVIDLAERYPNTAFAIVLSIVVTTLIGFIPWVGPFLASVLGPLLGAVGILLGGLTDMRARALAAREELLDKLAAAEKSGLLAKLPELLRLLDGATKEIAAAGGAKNAD